MWYAPAMSPGDRLLKTRSGHALIKGAMVVVFALGMAIVSFVARACDGSDADTPTTTITAP